MSLKADLAEGCTRLPELVERNDGATLLPLPEYEAGLTGSMARSFRSAFSSVVFLSVEETTAPRSLSSEMSCPWPVPLKTQDRSNDTMSMILFMTSTGANI